MKTALTDRSVLVIGRGSGIARAVVTADREAGGKAIVASRDQATLDSAYDGEVDTASVDVTDEASVAALAERLGAVDHVVSTASARARSTLADMQPSAVLLSLSTKVLGPI